MSRSVCGICMCPYGDDGGCACPQESLTPENALKIFEAECDAITKAGWVEMTAKQEAAPQTINSACNCTGACKLTGVCTANPLQGLSTFNQEWHNWEQLENARLIIEKQARRIAELEAACDVALEALENSSTVVFIDKERADLRDAAIAKLREALESCDADGYNPGLVVAALVKIKEVRP